MEAALGVVALLQWPSAPRFGNAKDVDRYYQALDPGNPRVMLFGSMAGVVGLILLVVDLAPLLSP